MSHGPQAFKKTDVARACRAVQAAGLEIARVEVSKDGTITVVPGKPDVGGAGNPWDTVLPDATKRTA